MIDELRDDLVYQLVDVLFRLILLDTVLVLLADLASQRAEVLVAPAHKVLA